MLSPGCVKGPAKLVSPRCGQQAAEGFASGGDKGERGCPEAVTLSETFRMEQDAVTLTTSRWVPSSIAKAGDSR